MIESPNAIAASERSLVGRVIAGRYRLIEQLAEGGMATVYRAVQDAEPREVAVKIMHTHLAIDRSFIKRFEREARLARRLSHPRIVRVLEHGADGEILYLVMELLDGEDLFDVLRRERTLDEVSARRVMIEVCEALAEAHGLGVVHRDLKLENVFIARDARGDLGAKVLDFGVAKMLYPEERRSSDSSPILTSVGALLGTVEYMSPEHCLGQTPGPPADIYACGVLLYALLCGRPPFTSKNPIEIPLRQIEEQPTPPSVLRPGLDPALEAVVLRALAKDPAARHPSASAFAEALRALGPTPALSAEAVGLVSRAVVASGAPPVLGPLGAQPSDGETGVVTRSSQPAAVIPESSGAALLARNDTLARSDTLAAPTAPAIEPPRRVVPAVVIAAIALVVGAVLGFLAGRYGISPSR